MTAYNKIKAALNKISKDEFLRQVNGLSMGN